MLRQSEVFRSRLRASLTCLADSMATPGNPQQVKIMNQMDVQWAEGKHYETAKNSAFE